MGVRHYVAVIDDDQSICRSMARLLQNVGLNPIAYPSAEEFLDDGMRVPFSCLLVDIQLEGMSGLELHRRLIACKIRTPVIYITANDDPNVRQEAISAGSAGYFNKTDAGADIVAAIQQAVMGSNESPDGQ